MVTFISSSNLSCKIYLLYVLKGMKIHFHDVPYLPHANRKQITNFYSSVQYEDLHWWVELRSHVTNQVYVVVEVAHEVIRDIMCCSASVPDKLPLGHFVFDVGAGQVNGQQDQTVAQHIHRICGEMRVHRGQTGPFRFAFTNR